MDLHKLATQEVEAAFARYRSSENKRIALRKALISYPDERRLLMIKEQLTNPQQVIRAAQRGIFINYARMDEVFALELAERLQEHGIFAWLDLLSPDVEDDWYKGVQSALDRCGLMLSIISPNSQSDPITRAERDQFLDQGKLVLPLLKSRLNVKGVDIWLRPIDFIHDFEVGFHNLLNVVTEQQTRV